MMRENSDRSTQITADLAAARAEALHVDKLRKELDVANGKLGTSMLQVDKLKAEVDQLTMQVQTYRSDIDSINQEYSEMEVRWTDERCQWTQQLKALELHVHKKDHLAKKIIDETNQILQSDLMNENVSLKSKVAILEVKIQVLDAKFRREKQRQHCLSKEDRNKAVDYFTKWVEDQNAVMLSLHHVHAQIGDVFGGVSTTINCSLPTNTNAWSYWERIKKNIPDELLMTTLEIFLKQIVGRREQLTKTVWEELKELKVVKQSTTSVWSMSGESEVVLQNWCTQLGNADWSGDLDEVRKRLRKRLKLDHQWKMYKGVKYSRSDVDTIRHRERSGHPNFQAYLVARTHEEFEECCGFCLSSKTAKILHHGLSVEDADLCMDDQQENVMYLWTDAEDHVNFKKKFHRAGFESDDLPAELRGYKSHVATL